VTCGTVLPLLRDYVDRELDGERTEAVERHLRDCASCAARVQAERDLKQALRARVRAGPAPAGLSGQILRRLHREQARGLRPRRRLLVVTSAVGVLAVVLGVSLWNRAHPPRLVSELVDDHIRYLVSAVPAEPGTADPVAAERWLEEQLNLAVPVPRFAADGPRLIGARRCYVLDRQVALLFYEDRKERLSLFVMDDRGLDLDGLTRVDVPEAECAMESFKGYHIVGWKHSGLLFALVGRGPDDELIELCRPALRP
jgi:anti-sigma factor (TIGR02949 family)